MAIAPPGQKRAASPRRYNMRALWTLCGWGSAAALALLAVALTSVTNLGSERLRLALAPSGMPAQALATIGESPRPTPKSDALSRQLPPQPAQTAVKIETIARPDPPSRTAAETERLAATVRELTADRDRLSARMAELEQRLADVTGSIARQSAAAAPATPGSIPTVSGTALAEPPAVPVLNPPVGAPALGSDLVFASEIASPLWESVRQPAARPWPTPQTGPGEAQPETSRAEAVASLDVASPAETQPARPSVPESNAATDQSEQDEPAADPPELVEVPLPRMRVAATPHKPDYAVDLGGAFSREALAARWADLKDKFGSPLRSLRPLIRLEKRFGYAPYRLVIGPLADEAAAKQLCTRLSGEIDCRPTRFTGDRLAQH